ncbi:MAG: iron-sulfur cluster assembly scaffold protein [Pseudomonadota bacterium]
MQENAELRRMVANEKELQSLYHREVLDAAKNPERFGRLQELTHKAIGLNPLCGDKVEIELLIDEVGIKHYRFQATGCALCIASGSAIGALVESQSVSLAASFANITLQALAEQNPSILPRGMQLFNHVHQFPTRGKCASLAPRTLLAALTGEISPVSCE